MSLEFANVPEQQIWNSSKFPMAVSAKGHSSLPKLLKNHRRAIDDALANTGAILFRGFDLANATDFDNAVQAYGAKTFTYSESLSNAVRVNLTPRVFTANEAPPTTSIYLHHEMAQTPVYPSKLLFFCEIAPGAGGATPLCRSDILYEHLERQCPELVARFTSKGVRYTNTMPAENDISSGQGRSWKSTLGVETKPEAESRLQKLGYSWSWQDAGTLTVTTPILDAVRELGNERKVFFNQLIAAYRGWADSRNEPSKSVAFGDGTAIPEEEMAQAIQLSDELTYDLNWKTGDVVLIDNFIVMHGRRPYEGKRRVLASLIA